MLEFLQKLTLEVTIILLPFGSIIDGIGPCSDYGWAYVHEGNVVYICEEHAQLTKKFTEYHEIGHYFYFQYLSENERKNYEKIFESHKNSENSFIRKYSRSSSVESFADDFAYLYFMRPAKDENHAQRLDFVKNLILNYSSICTTQQSRR